ncbi:uncharacterized protein LOC126864678 isoform X2 [Bombus huntii]|uniref:uncharacterized protein LOC126864678 isoform X2 n=1 Tax=Bombus huntii TaxID=85661 RepID=UPI0021AA7EB1|nr:uncharacterized protein LOC126864678 isoform X2 [Bombus huntii]
MKRNVSNHSHRDEKLRLSRNGNYEAGLRRTEEERLRRRREWMIEQQRLREHEKLKEKKILEYEIRRAIEKGLPLPRGRFSHHSRSKSKSKSTENRHRTVTSNTSNTSILSKKLEPSDGTTPLFKGPEGTQVSAAELRRIKVDIHRNVPGKATTDDLQRDIINPEDVLVKRREGEGSKPIFEREEIKGTTVKTDEIEERRTVVVLNNENLESKSKMNKKYTTSSRNRSPSPRHRSSRHARSSKDERSYRERSRERSRERRERDRSREHRIPPSHYIEQIPVPVYYGDFPPRPIMVGPLVPIRGQVPPLGGTRHMIGPLRPFPPRFIPPDMYRLRPPLNPRFRPMY